MKNIQKNARTKPLAKWTKLPTVLALVALVLVGGGVVTWKVHRNATVTPVSTSKPYNSIDYHPGTKEDNATSDSRKGSSNPADTLDNGSSSTDSSNTLGVTIVSANSNSTNVHIGTLVSGATSGTCTLTASQSGQQDIVLSASIQRDVNSYDCGVFNIATTTFTNTGTWNFTLKVTDGTHQATGSTTLTVNR